ncbi:MAG: non-canonical purine NTP pyrophosphatase [Candidatus Lambdaproteobacteria bacterium]|nr:non-canonical purine NTP pyrophosphatase [Candidatus Lambdaproteobacteria bacterium]
MARAPLVFVTTNAGKLREAAECLGAPVRGVALALEELQSSDLEQVVRHKAARAFAQLGRPLLVEDTALVFRAWGALPGPFIRHFEQHLGLAGMVRALAPFGDDAAEAICGLGYHDGRAVHYFEGRSAGRIVAPRGSAGFGWDPIFRPEQQPEGQPAGSPPRTYAEMTPTEKNAISHRRRAFDRLSPLLAAQL